MGKTDIFLDKYRQLEDAVRTRYGEGFGVARLEDLGEFRRYSSKIKYCRELRNLLVHNPKIDGEWAAEVNEAMIDFVGRMSLLVLKPPRVCECALSVKEIMYSTLEENVFEVMQQMKQRDISKVPILDRGKVVGVFSHDSVFSRVLSENGEISKDMVFRDMLPELTIEGERAKHYCFAKWTEYTSDIEKMFDESSDHHIRIKVIFLTKNGRSDEKLIGMVTPWELMDTE